MELPCDEDLKRHQACIKEAILQSDRDSNRDCEELSLNGDLTAYLLNHYVLLPWISPCQYSQLIEISFSLPNC